jgi:hypothetical protein
MKKILAAVFAVALMGAMATPALADSDTAPGQNKVTICHVTPGNSVTLEIPEDQANGHLTGKAAGHDLNGPVEDYLGACKTTPPPPDDEKKITICHKTGSESNPTEEISVSVSAWPAHQEHGDTEGKCPTTPPTTPPTPPADPPAGPPAPPTDYCANLEGVQWEGYDCNTGQVVPVVPRQRQRQRLHQRQQRPL